MNKELIEDVARRIMNYLGDDSSAIEKAEEVSLIFQQEFKEQKSQAELNIGKWLSSALDDENTCTEMKIDIVNWFTFIEAEK
jgi:hypothetical protein